MSETTHTPIPWSVIPPEPTASGMRHHISADGGKTYFCVVYAKTGLDEHRAEAAARAALIVRAVNIHGDLGTTFLNARGQDAVRFSVEGAA
jgi:hypothetical protein